MSNINKSDYVVVMVFSRWSLRKICDYLAEKVDAKEDQIGLIRIDRGRDGNESNRTIILLKHELFERCKSYGYTESQRDIDFRISVYEVKEHNLPKEGYSRNFYIPLPKEISGENATHQIQNKINILIKCGMFPNSVPRLKIPIESRETGNHRGRAFVTFSRNTNVKTLALARICLHDTRLYTSEDNFGFMKCFWAKEIKRHKQRPKRNNKKSNLKSDTTTNDVSESDTTNDVSELNTTNDVSESDTTNDVSESDTTNDVSESDTTNDVSESDTIVNPFNVGDFPTLQ